MKVGLILISHGSPSKEWNTVMEEAAARVAEYLETTGGNPFSCVKLAHLEFVAPSIADVCDSFESAGIERIIALPIFISISSHTNLDIPNALNIGFNLDCDSKIRRYLGNVPITLCPPLDHGPVLPLVISECASAISLSPEREAALILSHGDGCEHFWNHLHRRIAASITQSTGIEDVSWVIVQTGRSEAAKNRFKVKVDEILARGCDRLLILSCFTGLSGKQFIDRLTPKSCTKDPRLVGDLGWDGHPAVISQLAHYACQAAKAVGGEELIEPDAKSLPPYNPPFWLTRDL